eukprot:325734_1
MVYNILLVILFSMQWYLANSWIPTRSDVVGEISANNEGTAGSWPPNVQYCNEGTFGKGYRLSVEPEQGVFVDDTAVNTLTFWCSNNEAIRGSNGGSRGINGPSSYCNTANNAFMDGFRQNTDRFESSTDQTGLNDVDIHCNDDAVITVNNGHESWG